MKPTIALFVFILAAGLSHSTFAAETEVCTGEKTENCSKPKAQSVEEHATSHATESHKAAHPAMEHHSELAQKMNSLFPEKQKDPTGVVTPLVTKLESPKFLAVVPAGTVKLQWAAAQNATTYQVQIATDSNFKWLVTNELNVAGTTFDAANLESGKRYYWRVASIKADNESMYTKSIFVGSAFDVK